MPAQAGYIINCFMAHILHKMWVTGVHGSRKHKVLPYHNTQAIAEIVKSIIFINPSSPYPQHITMRLLCRYEEPAIFCFCETGQKYICRYPVSAFHERGTPIDLKIERPAYAVGVLNELNLR